MKIVSVEQGSYEWALARVGIVTSSRMHRVMSPQKRGYSKAAEGLLCEFLAEWMLRAPLGDDWMNAMMAKHESGWTDRGHELEADARNWYALMEGVEVQTPGFVTTDDGDAGCSPDGLTENGGLEIKTPKAENHIRNLITPDIANWSTVKLTQVQGTNWVCEREYTDVLSWHPSFLRPIVRVYRDEPYIADLKSCVAQFNEEFAAAKERIEQMGDQDPRYWRARDASDPNAIGSDEMHWLEQDMADAVASGYWRPSEVDEMREWIRTGEWMAVRLKWSVYREEIG